MYPLVSKYQGEQDQHPAPDGQRHPELFLHLLHKQKNELQTALDLKITYNLVNKLTIINCYD
ncbi:MAG: hypothetical protein D3912_10145 [Candidatus Electrothrix sp. AX1]|nr:hypothetical protein [Candidatus Electrothrix sp. AX1]